jgi:4-hydroxy-4-methyl-2-oxoglutarate aldolase
MTSAAARLMYFSRFDTATVSDALDRLEIPGVIYGIRRLATRSVIVGYAETVQLGPDDGSPSTRHLCASAIAEGGPNTVIIVAGGRLDCGGWGGLLSRAAQQRSIRGVIVDGASRDVDEAEEIGFPVYARTGAPATARGRQRELRTGEPVVIDGITVSRGDLLLADGTGVVVVPANRIDEVGAVARDIYDREQGLAERLAAGEPVTAVLGVKYETMLTEGDSS